MAFKDVLSNFKKDIGLCYQSQKNVVDVAQRYIGELEKAYEGGGSGGGIDYSETEQDTGLKWIDGSKLYQKTYVIDALPSAAGYQDISLGLSNIDVKHSFGDLKWASGTTRPFGAVGMDKNSPATWYAANQITYSIEENSYIRIIVGADRRSVSATITIQYTKTA